MRNLWRIFSTVLGVIFRHPVLGVTAIAILPDERLVLVRAQGSDRWGLPGGLVDWGEDVPTALRREIQEETGLVVVRVERLVGIYSAADRDPRLHSINVSIATRVQGEFAIGDELEIVEVRAFTPAEVPWGRLRHDHDRQLQDYLSGATTIA
ncbi:MAG: NUDIX hydrolase [Spirulinaceae cyanobacterium SM2_1_0]|nr:NUDIX hydrolase [Spirulinaceae cyanobacterium SM2_1_0]